MSYTAFEGTRRLATGSLPEVGVHAAHASARSRASVLVFEDATGRVVDLDLRGSDDEIRRRAGRQVETPKAPAVRRGPGRPRLGVVGKEVTLLPRHWAWLDAQPAGASATLRRLVDEARKTDGKDGVRTARDATYRFLSAMAGNQPGYEEALRALYRGERRAFFERVADWPEDLPEYLRRTAAPAFGGEKE